MAGLAGRFNDGRSAASQPVSVHVRLHGIEIRGADGLLIAFWRREDLREEGRLSGPGLRLRCGADEYARLTVDSGESLRPLLPERRSRFPLARLAVAVTASVTVAGGFWLGIPLAARGLASAIPPSLERQWGDSVALAMEKQWPRCSQPAGQAALGLLTDRLAAAMPADLRPRRVVVVRVEQENALALPGGNVLIFSGLLAKASGPNELAGVLAHEFTHLAERHPTAALIRAMGVGIVVALITGDTSGTLASASAMAAAGAYSRDDEAAADRGAAALLAQAGLDGGGLATFFRRLQGTGLVPAWLSTHPAPEERARAVEALARPGAVALTESQWQALRAICR